MRIFIERFNGGIKMDIWEGTTGKGDNISGWTCVRVYVSVKFRAWAMTSIIEKP